MSFQLQITVSSIEEAERILACLRHDADPAVVKDVAAQIPASASNGDNPGSPEPALNSGAPAQEPKKRGRPRREVAPPLPESAAPVATATEGSSPSQPDENIKTEPAQQTHTLDAARKALKDVQAKYGTADMEKPLALLSQFGAGRVSEVKAEDYAAFIAACKAA